MWIVLPSPSQAGAKLAGVVKRVHQPILIDFEGLEVIFLHVGSTDAESMAGTEHPHSRSGPDSEGQACAEPTRTAWPPRGGDATTYDHLDKHVVGKSNL